MLFDDVGTSIEKTRSICGARLLAATTTLRWASSTFSSVFCRSSRPASACSNGRHQRQVGVVDAFGDHRLEIGVVEVDISVDG